MNTPPAIILGIDPGTIVMGYAAIDVSRKDPQLLGMDVLKMTATKDAYQRLETIHKTICEIIVRYKPTGFAIEAPFFGKNVQSMLKLGRAQGVAIAAAIQYGLPVTEYSPKKVKQSITGNGNADKEQVWKMLQRLLSIEEQPRFFDATDALAVALCHHFQTSNPITAAAATSKGWQDFIAKNPTRLVRKA